nr:ComF family protein [uncultured Bacillus sp.]
MPEYCIICLGEISPKTGWTALIDEEKPQTVCSLCQTKLQKVEGEICALCSRPLNQLEPRFIQNGICYDCVRWERDHEWQGCLQQNHSLFLYNDFLQEVIARFKFRGDYIIASVFSEWIQQKLQNQPADFHVPIPLSPERLHERGFNQAEALIHKAGLKPANILTRIHTEKQSKKSRTERIHLQQVFQLQSNHALTGKRIILFDDIYTTGSTLHHAAKLIKEAGAELVSSITIGRG